jgi:hypothetical protein
MLMQLAGNNRLNSLSHTTRTLRKYAPGHAVVSSYLFGELSKKKKLKENVLLEGYNLSYNKQQETCL